MLIVCKEILNSNCLYQHNEHPPLKSLNTIKDHTWLLEINAGNRHINMAGLNRLMGSKPSLFSIHLTRNKYLQFLFLNGGYYKVRVALIKFE